MEIIVTSYAKATERQRRLWNKQAPRYDRQIGFWERHLFGDARQWVCAQATGDVLEVAIGTGRNLPFYPADIRLTGIDLSAAMLDIARTRAEESGREITLEEADAHALPFDAASFDTVVCTFSLCNIPDYQRAITEMHRVLRPDGVLLLADHVVGTSRPIRVAQQVLEKITFRLAGDTFTRRPLLTVENADFTIEQQERYKKGIVERLRARREPAGTKLVD